MTRAEQSAVLCIAFCLYPASARASVIVTSSLSLTQFQILPSAGSVQFISPISASAFAQVFDSLGGADVQYDSVDDGATSVGASTALVNATAAASAVHMTASSTASLNIGNITAAAGTVPGSPYGLLQGYFEIVGTSAPVLVQLRASLAISQSLSTTGFGLSASSEAIFSFLLPDISGQPILFLDVPLSIGPNASAFSASTPTLSAMVMLQPNTPYFFLANSDPEVSGQSQTPEPSSFLLLFTGLGVCAIALRHRKSHAVRD